MANGEKPWRGAAIYDSGIESGASAEGRCAAETGVSGKGQPDDNQIGAGSDVGDAAMNDDEDGHTRSDAPAPARIRAFCSPGLCLFPQP